MSITNYASLANPISHDFTPGNCIHFIMLFHSLSLSLIPVGLQADYETDEGIRSAREVNRFRKKKKNTENKKKGGKEKN